MRSEETVHEKTQLLSAYREYEAKVLARGLMVGNLLSVVGVPGGFVLDYFLYPQRFLQFLIIRLCVAAILLAIAGILYLDRNHYRLTKIKTLGVLSALAMNFAFCLMI